MNTEIISLVVRCQLNPSSQTFEIQVVRVDTGEEVQLSNGAFLLRLFPPDAVSQTRCFIRHLTSGREAYVQGGPNLNAFIEALLFHPNDPATPSQPTSSGSESDDPII